MLCWWYSLWFLLTCFTVHAILKRYNNDGFCLYKDCLSLPFLTTTVDTFWSTLLSSITMGCFHSRLSFSVGNWSQESFDTSDLESAQGLEVNEISIPSSIDPVYRGLTRRRGNSGWDMGGHHGSRGDPHADTDSSEDERARPRTRRAVSLQVWKSWRLDLYWHRA